jgi:hypothetical protein
MREPRLQPNPPPSAYDRLVDHLQRHGTAAGLDLSNADLEGVVLDGLNLDGIKLGDYARRRGARLERASLVGTSLRSAALCFADFTGAKMRRADLTGADLAYAILDHADLRWAALVETDLYQASLLHTNLAQADLTHVDLYLARLDGTLFSRADLHPPLLQEDSEAHNRFLADLARRRGRPMDSISPPLARAREIYQALKTNWRAIGRPDDASWAYVRERRTERALHAPWRAARFFGQELSSKGSQWRFLAWPGFYLRHTIAWGLSWLADLTCGYGEFPWRAALVALAVLLLFPFLYRASGGIKVVHDTSPLDYLIYSISAFTTFGFDNYQAINWQAQLLTGIEALLGIALFALLMFTLGNRISRL